MRMIIVYLCEGKVPDQVISGVRPLQILSTVAVLSATGWNKFYIYTCHMHRHGQEMEVMKTARTGGKAFRCRAHPHTHMYPDSHRGCPNS